MTPDIRSQSAPARYVVGFDLGTTNSAVCYVDTTEKPWRVRTFAVPQLVAQGVVEARETLPSFHYQPTSGETAKGALRCPWQKEDPTHTVGVFARDQGTLTPGRMISSAKSWLCHSGVDRTAELLPWHGAADVERLSPVEVSARYLAHVAEAWNARFARHPLAEQDFVLTLPASFDEVARELTVKAASMAGLPRVVLIEEPQAAFYAWIYAHSDDWETLVRPGQKILVCDIGGGTSDFTLIRVRRGEGGKVQFHRVAVGDHLILGGDNFDLALAHHIERRLASERVPADAAAGQPSPPAPLPKGEGSFEVTPLPEGEGSSATQFKLDLRQWSVLVNRCRELKETLLSANPPERLTVNLPAAGKRLIGGALQIEVTREQMRDVLLEGFFPQVGLEEKPRSRRSGFQEFGLPYAPDPAITRYLAAFLSAHRHVGLDEAALQDDAATADHDPAQPDIVLFNGGVFLSSAIRQRVLEVLENWFHAQPIVLDNERLDLAVARGAAYYGMVRRGEGVRIAAGLARTYYIGVESAEPAAVCLLPAGVESGQDIDLIERPFDLLVSEPVEFPLYVSSTRLTDRPGQLVPIDREQMTPLPPMRTVLRTRKKGESDVVPVNLHARLTEIGTLDLWCSELGGKRSWRLQFDVRSATQTDIAAHQSAAEREGFVDEALWQQCRALVEGTFGPDGNDKPEGLIKRLAAATGISRNLWPTSLCRRIWEALMEVEAGRRRSQVHEARWLNLLGFALRPGYGLAVDDWRVAETWRNVQGKLIHSTAACRGEGWILWRRIGGGLAAGQQQAVAEPLLGPVRNLHRQLTTGKGRGGDFSFSPHETGEIWRLLGSLELLPVVSKVELGNMLLEMLPKRRMEPVRPAMAWAIGRIGSRVPLYGPLNTVVPADMVGDWLKRLMEQDSGDPATCLALMQMARRTNDRYRDVSEKRRTSVIAWLERAGAPQHFIDLVRDVGRLDAEEQGLIFGESLPKGLRIG